MIDEDKIIVLKRISEKGISSSILSEDLKELIRCYDLWQMYIKSQPRGAIPQDPIDVQKQCCSYQKDEILDILDPIWDPNI